MLKKLMLMDNDLGFCMNLKSNLEARGGFEVVATSDAQNAINLTAEVFPDLILLNILTPGMLECRVAEKLSHDKRTAAIPVVFLTSLEKSNGQFGNLHILSKLSSAEELSECIEEVLHECRMQPIEYVEEVLQERYEHSCSYA